MLQIKKLSNKTWKHIDTNDGAFILTKFYAKLEFNEFLIVESYGSKRRKYLISEIEVYDIGGTAETFANFEDLFLRLEALKYTGFYKDGDIDLDWGSITGTLSDQTDLQNALDSKVDKVTTTGVERAYIINADGSQDTKAMSSFKEVIEGYFNGINFYTDALFTNLITPESGKIYLNLSVTPSTQYRWSGSAYAQIGGSSWGSITGTLSNQTDLQNALNALQDNTHRFNFYVASSTEGSGLLFDGLVGVNRFTEQGTRSFVNPNGTTRLLSLYFQNYLSATTLGANAGIKQTTNSDGNYRQGFDNYFVFGNNDENSNCQTTVGHYSLLAATMPNTAISAFTGDFVGVGNDVGDTNLSFYAHRTPIAGQTASYVKVDCGANFPAHNTTSAYLLRMEAPQTEVDDNRYVKLTITNLITGATFTHTFPYTETPVLNRSYATTVMRSNRNTGVATNIKFGKIQVIRKIF